MKKCIKCNIEKDDYLFNKYSLSSDGLQCWCRECGEKWRRENKEKIALNNKRWRLENIVRIKEKAHNDYRKNSEELKQWQRDYREKYPDRKKEADRKSYAKHGEQKRLTIAKWQTKNKIDWEGFVPTETQCGACGVSIFFNKPEMNSTIFFDHRHGGTESIKDMPTIWLRSHARNKENEELWESCDFGTLCFRCNTGLPTMNRTKHIIGLVRYHFGEEASSLLSKEMSKLGDPAARFARPGSY